MDGVITLELLDNLSTIRNACLRNAKVRWLDPNGEDVREGTMRHLVRDADYPAFLHADDDVREAFVRITGTTGAEYFLPILTFASWLEGYVAFDS